MSLKRKYFKNKPVCKATFSLVKENALTASKVNLAGEFNNWDIESIPMKKTKNGEFSVTIELEKGKEYQFKYFVDGKDWINEMDADKFEDNEFGNMNSVIIV